MEFSSVSASEILFKAQLTASQFSVIFIVEIRGTTCVMKVHHNPGKVEPVPLERETDIHVCEATAYERLKKHGLCNSGIIPQFYGSIKDLDLRLYQPHLDMFLNDKYPPSALFLEYIPHMEMILPQHYNEERATNLVHGIRQIHEADVLHCDVKPRNMMIIKSDPGRIVWLDFDRAQTYNKGEMNERQTRFICEEEIKVSQFTELLETDYARNCIQDTYLMYCT
ncbi:hypothetical protein P170DRAFT_400097 [Aspergillus steynii IBT 23096]|uniref:Protein kinase domain-containing protein n=1 Tax=Aspergillus steynii IBT 23096 TaxID=1392250 RepID=A0A2I2GS79_9EURO|nr:uncharacterized protein P170DRAFT_400097 [Aspergillus steynii IBT 23096]PLB55729.1 hypothetical protein P170DRAFT_400097 [Aspergillus steynii IBT 23096]